MFPIPWNKAYRKKDGSLTTIDAAIQAGGEYTLPTASDTTKGGVKVGSGLTMTGEVLSADAQVPAHTSEEAGKVLKVASDGTLEWDTGGAGGGYYSGKVRPVLVEPGSTITFKYGFYLNPPSKGAAMSGTPVTGSRYSLDDLIDFSLSDIIEIQLFMREDLVTALGATLLGSALPASTSIELSSGISNYDVIILEGVYDSGGSTSQYDTTILYKGMTLNTEYWFGVKDRNSTYSGTVTFVDDTHGTLSAERRLKVYGMNL